MIWYSRVGSGGEHTVYRNKETNLALKVTYPNAFGHSVWADGAAATPAEYLQRLDLHNILFGDNIQICGLILAENHVQIVTTQPWIEANEDNPIPEPSEIDAFFSDGGFQRVDIGTPTAFYFDSASGILIGDARDENFIRSTAGEIVPIDLVIGYPGPQLLARIRDSLKS